jgi:hypothetical protein
MYSWSISVYHMTVCHKFSNISTFIYSFEISTTMM